MATTAYVVLLGLAALFTFISCWIPAVICAALAMALAGRFEIRWLLDHTRLTPHKPRPIPQSPKHLRPKG